MLPLNSDAVRRRGNIHVAHKQLEEALLPLSKASTWREARQEWILRSIFRQDSPQTCPCGHFPIYEICVLVNRHTRNTAEVGNVCVKKFLGIRSDRIFLGLRTALLDIEKAMTREAIEHAHAQSWITNRQYTFYIETIRKRLLSQAQLNWRVAINRRVLANSQRQQPRSDA